MGVLLSELPVSHRYVTEKLAASLSVHAIELEVGFGHTE